MGIISKNPTKRKGTSPNPPPKLYPASLGNNCESNTAAPRLRFRLLDEADPLKESLEDIAPITMRNVPVWVRSEVKRQISDSDFSEESAMCVCIAKALVRLEAIRDRELWEQLSEAAIGTKQEYEDPDDFDEVNRLCSTFSFTIDDNHGEHYTRNLRMPRPLKNQVAALAPKLGLTLSTLAQILLIDGLRSQTGVIHGALMDTVVETFYRKLRKRLLKLAHNLRAYEISLCDEVVDVLQELKV